MHRPIFSAICAEDNLRPRSEPNKAEATGRSRGVLYKDYLGNFETIPLDPFNIYLCFTLASSINIIH